MRVCYAYVMSWGSRGGSLLQRATCQSAIRTRRHVPASSQILQVRSMATAMDVVAICIDWSVAKKIHKADPVEGAWACFSADELQKKFAAGANLFSFDVKRWVVQEVALIDVHEQNTLKVEEALACSQLQAAMLHLATLGTRGQCSNISAYSQLRGFVCTSSRRVLDLPAGTEFGAFTCGHFPEAYGLDCLEKLAVKEDLDKAQNRGHLQHVVKGVLAQTLHIPGPEKEPVAITSTAAAMKPKGMKALPSIAGRRWKPLGLVFASVLGQIRAATVENGEEDQEAVYKHFATQAVFEIRGFFGTGGFENFVRLMWFVVLAFAAFGFGSLLWFASARKVVWRQPQPEARTCGEGTTQTEEPAGPAPAPPEGAHSATPSPTRPFLPLDRVLQVAGG